MIIFSFFIFFVLFSNLKFETQICNSTSFCNNCIPCDKSHNICQNCKYDNYFCKVNNSILYKTNDTFLKSFDLCDIKISNSNKCGSKDITFGNENKLKILEIEENENELKNNDIICNYKYKTNNNEALGLKFTTCKGTNQNFEYNLYIIYKNINNKSTIMEKYNKNNISKYNENSNDIIKKYLNYSYLSIYIEISKTINGINPKLYLNLYKGNNGSTNDDNECKKTIIIESNESSINKSDESSETKSSSSVVTEVAISIVAGIVALSIIIIISYFLITRKKTNLEDNQNNQNANNNQNRNNIRSISPSQLRHEERERKKKLEKELLAKINKTHLDILFRTSMSEKIYRSEMNEKDNSNCTICFENLVENVSRVCVTPCKHIFHFKCLKEWLIKEILNPRCPNCNNLILENDSDKKNIVDNIQNYNLETIQKLAADIENNNRDNLTISNYNLMSNNNDLGLNIAFNKIGRNRGNEQGNNTIFNELNQGNEHN